MRRTTSSTRWALKVSGARRSALSMVSCTSACLREARPPEPAKITSSMPPARSALAELAPITQRSASSRFDLPQPFGPTLPVSPGSILNSVGSTKDLKPERRSRWKCTASSASLFAGRGEGGVELLEAHFPLVLLAVDEEGRRGADAGVDRRLHPRVDVGVARLAAQAGVELWAGHSA